MSLPIDGLAGLAIALLGWLAPRVVAKTRFRLSSMLLLDLAMPIGLFSFVATLTARPMFAGVLTFVIGAAYAYADRSKRRVLAEPIVFTDVFQAPDIFRHPELALPFPHKGRIVLGVAALTSLFILLFLAENPAWQWTATLPITAAVLMTGIAMAIAGPCNGWTGRWIRRQRPSEDPHIDAASLGPLATLLGHAILAKAERSGLISAALDSQPRPSSTTSSKILPPVVVVQCESFFDARRLSPEMDRQLLTGFDRCCASSVQSGHFRVPTWGANTVRTEFAVLSGLEHSQLGLDRYNPYLRFARQQVPSLAWQMKQRGYKTICLHPYDKRFYGRDRVLPYLGFDQFLGEELFHGATRINNYVSDLETARVAQEILNSASEPTMLFVITMENHGPWQTLRDPSPSLIPAALRIPAAEKDGLEHYLRSLRNADQMLSNLTEQMTPDGIVAFYGDHLPSFPSSFQQLGMQDTSTDYVIWRARKKENDQSQSNRCAIQAHQLGEAILQALDDSAVS